MRGPNSKWVTLYEFGLKLTTFIWFWIFHHHSSCHWLFLFVSPKCMETASCNFDDLESNTWEITLGMSWSTETGNQNFVVLINETHTTVPWNVGGDSLVILLELNPNTLSNGGVWLLGFDGNLLNNNTSCVRSTYEWFFPLRSWILFLETQISPPNQRKWYKYKC